ncbi:four-carbon acid sugar kinase family protein [Mucilaginibacter sp. L196]|uniref:four-carbon acid sugar kinase family protein n=1 Tax=Mucilaginibacter sp. L196 TaxID=1641870 RepID=UPI00131C89CF|nr:four-carbon acid sugar kinase family protein [Mucilaginibacter sp. L196]
MGNTRKLLLAYYGDDFTGSTDALEFLSRAGIKTVLFIEPPTPQMLARYDGLQAVGVAGMTRAMPPDEMKLILQPAFEALKALGASHVHYKVCSTFDSSPQIGSIGQAINVGAEVFNALFIPLLVAAPALGRYCIFGNLFARMGIGSQGEIFRLDRHPSMSLHPVTPADESDLRLHLSRQTEKATGLIDVLVLAESDQSAHEKLASQINSGKQVILFDALTEEHLSAIGKLIDKYAACNKPLFSVGSSGISMALGKHFTEQEIVQSQNNWPTAGKAENMLVVSGSCSPVTAKQIAYAVDHGFAEIALDTPAIANSTNIERTVAFYVNMITELLDSGIPVIIHTSLGNDDPRFAQTYQIFTAKGLTPNTIGTKTAELFGTALGLIAVGVAGKKPLTRIIIAGGDTSGYVARAMGIEAVEMIAPLSPGAPLCKAYAPGSPAHGLEVNFKGGQVGSENYFETVLQGKIS